MTFNVSVLYWTRYNYRGGGRVELSSMGGVRI